VGARPSGQIARCNRTDGGNLGATSMADILDQFDGVGGLGLVMTNHGLTAVESTTHHPLRW
jgi:hypothetical protein